MSYKMIKKLPPIEALIRRFPLSTSGAASIAQHRLEIESVLRGTDDRLIMVVGPCSAWPYDAVIKYAEKLLKVNEQVKHALKLVMRVYIQKPRTIKGWTGPINQPDPRLPPDIEKGIDYARSLMVKVVEMGLPIADEALFTHNARGFLELLSWVAIGARSGEDQEHRIFASSLDLPVGIKNPTHGSLQVGVNGVVAAQQPHSAIFDGFEIETDGNPFAHLVLRGGDGKPNYDIDSIAAAAKYLDIAQVANPAIVVDVSHDNCLINGKKDWHAQPKIVLDVLKSLETRPDLRKYVKGFMLESFIKSGNQNADTAQQIDLDGLSITDPCIGFDETAELLLQLAER